MKKPPKIEKWIPEAGDGVFTVSDVVRIFKLDYVKVSYWFGRYVKDKFVGKEKKRYYYERHGVTVINFFMLIELFVFYQMREHKISAQRILKYHTFLKEIFKTDYPFATDKIILSGRDLYMKLSGGVFFADQKYQWVMEDIIKPWAQQIEFDTTTGLPTKFYPLGKNRMVVVSPANQFGEPTVAGTNIKASVLQKLYAGGETLDFIAKLYNIERKKVEDAIEFANAA